MSKVSIPMMPPLQRSENGQHAHSGVTSLFMKVLIDKKSPCPTE